LTSRFAEIAPKARRDIENHVLWLRSEADVETASRFARAAIQTFAKLADAPGLGQSLTTANPALTDLRKWRVDGFRKILIFYQPLKDGVRIIRVLHASADWWSLLDVN
jgi:toxin ParE1/3/4